MTPHRFPPPGRSRFHAPAFIVAFGLVGLLVAIVVLIVWVLLRVVGWFQQ